MKSGSITVFSALAFMLAASFLFALLEAGRMHQLAAYADMTSELAVESVCAEYQPGLWEDYRLLCLDGAYGGTEFSVEYVTAVLGARIRTNLMQEGDGGRVMGLALDMTVPNGYQLLTDDGGDVFLKRVSGYMQENLPMEAAQALYDRYMQTRELEDAVQTQDSVENAKLTLEEAKRKWEEEKNAVNTAADSDTGTVDGGDMGQAEAGRGEPAMAEPQEVQENPLDVVLALKRNALLGMVTGEAGSLSAKQLGQSETLAKRSLEQGTMQEVSAVSWYDKILTLEYLDAYFADYLAPAAEHALSYELEYVLCGKRADRENLEGTVERLLFVREAANVTHILTDAGKRSEALSMATTLAGFTGNPAVIQIVQIGIVAAWAYVESILDLRALLAGDKIALLKSAAQWTSGLGGLIAALGDGAKAKDCENGVSYQGYVKSLLFAMGDKNLAYRMMDVMEQNLRLTAAYQNCRMDHMICQIDYDVAYAAEPLFWRFLTLSSRTFSSMQFQTHQRFSYY